MNKPAKVTAYKAFDENMQCRDFQYEVGGTYKHDGDVAACYSGFHACENPLDCLNYYDITSSRFAVVELSGDTDSNDHDSKIAAAEIHVKAEIKLPDFIKRSVDYLLGLVESGDEAGQADAGDSAKLAASGYSAQLAASGENSVIASASCSARAKGAKGTWISLAEFNSDGDCIGFATGCIGKKGLKEDVWYSAKGGKLVAA